MDGGWVIQKYYGIGGDAWERSRNIGRPADNNPWRRTDNFGCDTLSSLASALGAFIIKGYAEISNIDNLKNSGWYRYYNNGQFTLILVFGWDENAMQVKFDNSSIGYRYFTSDSWSSWKSVSLA